MATAIATEVAMTMASRADAQAVAIVNGDPITAFDVEQRAKLIQLSTHQNKPRNEVVEELINEKIKVQLQKRFAIDGIDKDVDNAYANMARRMRATPKQFSDNLEKSGVKAETLKLPTTNKNLADEEFTGCLFIWAGVDTINDILFNINCYL